MNRQAQAAVLFLVGAAVLHAGLTDLYLRYVKAGLRPLLLAAGVVLIMAAVATVWYERRGRGEAGDGDGHGHVHREPRVAWLLVLPLLALILVSPPALGSYSAMHAGTALQAPLAYPSLPATDPLPLGVVDYAGRAAYDHGRTLAHRRVEVTGFVALAKDGTPYLVRMALNCCAADAQPVKIGLTGHIPPILQPDTWLQVTGTYTAKQTKDPVNDGRIPFLDVTAAKPVPTPHDPYDESWNN
ncbi:TIGR03943 family protein [Streptomyces mirabilis]|uniref:TIGR03943 family putative permease subunit n=1 Tax=Streptomyces mirabilis TaxID=68239 RepID=UPI00331C35FD